MSLEQELRATSDSLLRALDRMNELEAEKRTVPTGSEKFVALAREVERLAVEVLRHTQNQSTLAETTEERADAGGGLGRPIATISAAPRDMPTILNEWRDAERALAAADPSSQEAAISAADVRRLRAEYRLAHEQIMSQQEHDRH
jgi:hypothetical protein